MGQGECRCLGVFWSQFVAIPEIIKIKSDESMPFQRISRQESRNPRACDVGGPVHSCVCVACEAVYNTGTQKAVLYYIQSCWTMPNKSIRYINFTGLG